MTRHPEPPADPGSSRPSSRSSSSGHSSSPGHSSSSSRSSSSRRPSPSGHSLSPGRSRSPGRPGSSPRSRPAGPSPPSRLSGPTAPSQPSRPSRTSLILAGQAWHLVYLLLLFLALYAATHLPRFSDGTFLGLQTPTWFWLTIGNAILHQLYVWFAWRTELHGQLLTRTFGPRAFTIYAIIFAILILARPILITGLAIANASTLALPPAIRGALALVIAIPALATMISIKRYFGFQRAFGIDHFDPAYRDEPLVRKGIFRLTPNAMYVFGIAALWIPGLITGSLAATVAAGFSHLYIWVHYHCTEKPDMRTIYG